MKPIDAIWGQIEAIFIAGVLSRQCGIVKLLIVDIELSGFEPAVM